MSHPSKSNYQYFLSQLKREIVVARQKAYQTVNRQLIELYLNVGKGLHEKVEKSKWGGAVVERLSRDLQRSFPDMKGFSQQNLWRMKQLYEVYRNHEKLSPLVRELSWTHNTIILHHTQTIEEKEFYLKTCVHEKWSKRELERQLESSLFERYMLSRKTDKLVPRSKESNTLTHFKDEYVFDFLGLKDDFCENENPSVGMILCKSRNDEVVRIAMSKAVSRLKVATYKTKLIDQKLLKQKLHLLPMPESEDKNTNFAHQGRGNG
ncbi:MAG: DUF1016 domain-containing protein [Chlamydiae bacterium]|nr:DUF1016 domain-containing protein [Chlamydiota bacterium]